MIARRGHDLPDFIHRDHGTDVNMFSDLPFPLLEFTRARRGH
jgi:hypothetical protein